MLTRGDPRRSDAHCFCFLPSACASLRVCEAVTPQKIHNCLLLVQAIPLIIVQLHANIEDLADSVLVTYGQRCEAVKEEINRSGARPGGEEAIDLHSDNDQIRPVALPIYTHVSLADGSIASRTI